MFIWHFISKSEIPDIKRYRYSVLAFFYCVQVAIWYNHYYDDSLSLHHDIWIHKFKTQTFKYKLKLNYGVILPHSCFVLKSDPSLRTKVCALITSHISYLSQRTLWSWSVRVRSGDRWQSPACVKCRAGVGFIQVCLWTPDRAGAASAIRLSWLIM